MIIRKKYYDYKYIRLHTICYCNILHNRFLKISFCIFIGDERNCKTENYRYMCKNNRCISLDLVCNNVTDCSDGSDEGFLCDNCKSFISFIYVYLSFQSTYNIILSDLL